METKNTKTEIALFGAGCFWGVEEAFRTLSGVTNTTVGYAGGHTVNPSYEEVCTGMTGHAEVVKVEFDPQGISYNTLLEKFFDIHDPTQENRQGVDVGSQYRSIIVVTTTEQRKIAERKLTEIRESGRYSNPVVTQIEDNAEFYPAEEYHQQYLKKQGRSVCE